MDHSLEKTKVRIEPSLLELRSLRWKNTSKIEDITDNQYVRDATNYLLSGGIGHKGKHSDLWHRIKENMWKLICIRW
eukprot:7986381-Heterocapsa_arctica.AAC.1